MSKRTADEALEILELRREHPLASKRARLDDDLADSETTNVATYEAPLFTPIRKKDHGAKVKDVSRQVVGHGPSSGFSDLYLETVNRGLLDFDFEKLCSVSLSNINVYACLICGKYFQGRGRSSYAYTHSLDQDHHVFINISSLRVYVLPESYEVHNKTLQDIKYVVNPTYTKEDVMKLDREHVIKWDLAKRLYTPGFVGLNNIKQNDYLNVVVHALVHVVPLRNYFMLADLSSRPELAQRFSILVRKIWNPRAFKSHVSPHELLQEISLRSNKKFTLLKQADPVDFLSWFINNLHLSLGGSKTKSRTSIVQNVFQGKVRIESQVITTRADASDRLRFEEAAETKIEIAQFMLLTLDLPPRPIFKDDRDQSIIPQVPLTSILAKYDGLNTQEHGSLRRRYRLLHPLPPYLIFHIKRFTTNRFVDERNPTIVTFSTRSLDMSPYVEPAEGLNTGEPIPYDLIANITHETVAGTGKAEGNLRSVYKVHLLNRANHQWMQIQDLFVENVARELLFTSESYLQIWERRKPDRGEHKG